MGNKSTTAKNIDHHFIIRHNKNESSRHPPDDTDASICNKRVIFISLIGLYQTYKNCPAHILYSALCILPLKRQWIDSPFKYFKELQSVSSNLILRDLDFDSNEHHQFKDFLELIKWKDSQGFVFWAKDEYKISSSHNKIHPFWQHVSNKLVTLCDPTSSGNYKPLAFDTMHCEISIEVFCELYFMTLRYETMKTILHASNKKSFHVVAAYNNALCTIDHPQFVKYQLVDDDASDVQSDDEWWISSEY